jgi:hypothetical protein
MSPYDGAVSYGATPEDMDHTERRSWRKVTWNLQLETDLGSAHHGAFSTTTRSPTSCGRADQVDACVAAAASAAPG